MFLLCQILSATWTSPSLTWNWTVFLTCPTSPPSGTHCRCSSRPIKERSRRRSLRAQCYDATEFPRRLIKWNTTLLLHSPAHKKTPTLIQWPFASPDGLLQPHSGCHRHTSPVLDPEWSTCKKNPTSSSRKYQQIRWPHLKETSTLTTIMRR